MKKIISLFLMALLPLCANAYDAKIDGIYYNFNTETKTATVTYCYENNNNKNAYRGKVNIPATVNYEGETYDVAVIGGSAFRYCSDLTSVTIPGSVTRIDSYAFANCRGLTYVTIPNSVTSIGYYAFYECYGLTSVHISDIAAWCKISFSSYENNPLYYAKHLYLGEEEIKDLVIPNSVTSIEKYAFSGCSGLTSVTIPNSVTSIGWEAFQYCSGLASVHISDIAAWCNISFVNNTSNPLCNAHHLYLGDEEIKDLVIPNSVMSIGNSAFRDCSGLTSVTIPNSVTSIGAYAFRGCI